MDTGPSVIDMLQWGKEQGIVLPSEMSSFDGSRRVENFSMEDLCALEDLYAKFCPDYKDWITVWNGRTVAAAKQHLAECA